MGDATGLCLCVCIIYHYYRKCDALLLLTALGYGNCLNSLMKLYWHEPRPFFLSEHVVPHKCSNLEYGLPSGHAMGVMIVFRTFARIIEPRNSLPILQGISFVWVICVSYNRAV